jgi:hypothetical protein
MMEDPKYAAFAEEVRQIQEANRNARMPLGVETVQ